ncbi:MAG: hypothetical protein KC996_11470 [Phycisphaerales bacterium]|nr:hypothetical protein [Phycisphaerales bacterium]
MHTRSPERAHAIRALTLIAGIYILARTLNWTGPESTIRWMPELLSPAIAIITLWGVSRVFANRRP